MENQNHIVITGGEQGMLDICEIRNTVVHLDSFQVEDVVRVNDMTFMTAWELIVLGVDESGQVRESPECLSIFLSGNLIRSEKAKIVPCPC